MFTFQQNNGVFEIKGNLFFNENERINILKELERYSQNPQQNTHFHFKLGHMDDERAIKFISEIYEVLKPMPNLKIYWEHDIEDISWKDIGISLRKRLEIPFIIKESDFGYGSYGREYFNLNPQPLLLSRRGAKNDN